MSDIPSNDFDSDREAGFALGSAWTPLRALAVIVAVGSIWFAIDRATKLYFDQFVVGAEVGGPFLGLFDFTLVHNTGAAWGMFSDSTFALGINSLVISIVVVAAALFFARRSNWMLSLGAALVAAGGIGNAFDRFVYGYVVDFINLSFIDFPVFNVADIGVTCGCVLMIIALLFFWRESPKASGIGEDDQTASEPTPFDQGGVL